MRRPSVPTPLRIIQLAWGYAPPLVIHAALEHRLFDPLDRAPLTIAALAKRTGTSIRGLAAILNALVGLGLLARRGERYLLTPESSKFLVSGKPSFLGPFFQHATRDLIPKWLQISDVVRSGQPAMTVNDKSDGSRFFAEFVEALFPLNYAAASALGQHLKIAKTKVPVSVLDLGAGSGVWGIALAQQSPRVEMTAVDWADVLKVTRRVVKRHGLGKRLTTISGDLLEANFGSDHDIATLGHILHSEGRDQSRRLLKKTFSALRSGGTIAIAEFLVNHDRRGPVMGLLFAVNMLINTEVGDTFSFEEISDWLLEAGFRRPRALKVPGPSPLILATKP